MPYESSLNREGGLREPHFFRCHLFPTLKWGNHSPSWRYLSSFFITLLTSADKELWEQFLQDWNKVIVSPNIEAFPSRLFDFCQTVGGTVAMYVELTWLPNNKRIIREFANATSESVVLWDGLRLLIYQRMNEDPSPCLCYLVQLTKTCRW